MRHSGWHDFQGHPRSGSRSGDNLSPLSGLFFHFLYYRLLNLLLACTLYYCCCVTPSVIVSGVNSGLLPGHSSEERKLRVLHCSSWTVLQTRCISALCCWKTELSSTMHLIASNICWINKTSQQYCPLTFTPVLMKNNLPFFETAANTMIDLVNVAHTDMYCPWGKAVSW